MQYLLYEQHLTRGCVLYLGRKTVLPVGAANNKYGWVKPETQDAFSHVPPTLTD